MTKCFKRGGSCEPDSCTDFQNYKCDLVDEGASDDDEIFDDEIEGSQKGKNVMKEQQIQITDIIKA